MVNADKCNGCGACLRRCPEREQRAITIDVSRAKRFDPPAKRFLAAVEDRTDPVPPVSFGEWFAKRLETLGQVYGGRK